MSVIGYPTIDRMSRVFGADFGAAGNTKVNNCACIKRRKKQRQFSHSGLKPLVEVVLANASFSLWHLSSHPNSRFQIVGGLVRDRRELQSGLSGHKRGQIAKLVEGYRAISQG